MAGRLRPGTAASVARPRSNLKPGKPAIAGVTHRRYA